jgi:hypothetical protein
MRMDKRFTRTMSTLASMAAIALIAGCGDGDSSSSDEKEHEAAATPAKAVAEIAQVRQGLSAGLAAYRQGKSEKADQLVGDAYLEHFELVEGPLEARDEELSEELEELIRAELREEIQAGAKASEVAALVGQANRELDEAERALRG